MSNTIKQNSRFASLMEDEPGPVRNEKPKPRADYSDRPQRNRYTDKYTGGDQFDRNKQNQELQKHMIELAKNATFNQPTHQCFLIGPNLASFLFIKDLFTRKI